MKTQAAQRITEKDVHQYVTRVFPSYKVKLPDGSEWEKRPRDQGGKWVAVKGPTPA